jgi:hypothetical protein
LRGPFAALDIACALAADNLFGGVTAYGAQLMGKDGFELGQKIFRHFKARLPTMGPGDHYGLVDDVADLLGLRGWYHWDPISIPPSSAVSPEPGGIMNPGESAYIYSEEGCLSDAWSRFDPVNREEASRLARRIGVLARRECDRERYEAVVELGS